jgi:hypothetical protein
MNREKQIEEMAKIIGHCESTLHPVIECHNKATGCYCIENPCHNQRIADKLYNAGYRKQSEGEWISVEDRLPEAGKLVLCIWERGDDKQNYGFGRYQAHDVWYVSNEGMPCVTNWMLLPELPKMEGGDTDA